MRSAPHTIVRLSAADFARSVKALADLFAEVVADGASLGFVLPFGQEEAADWWRSRQEAVAAGTLAVWAAHGPGGLAGTIGLARETRPNGRHRAEVVKLMVHPAARGQGLGRALLATAERAAAQDGAALLLLDTETGSPAERLYLGAGWTRYGVVPDYAAEPGGALRDCSFYYKHLAA
ncbi:GNAT family N-acetyltransferase [Allonocardiopsis opalescens]|uniref:Ribosomal protein S18 acetylase RimI-like enzyme n=1 Tax=Allonocardiopsis opalescens TaxID=1144618 RepID=A0A2T0PZ81_9ACTN|nr:GNAT family N-acetyltransferase [Allonocardiopsis opalescens]PRX96717.1 ribosomal protein S18 acetylase RimI-like enzyme [Allonocardiopsis opalescens]